MKDFYKYMNELNFIWKFKKKVSSINISFLKISKVLIKKNIHMNTKRIVCIYFLVYKNHTRLENYYLMFLVII